MNVAEVEDKQFARRLVALIGSGLITHRHYYPWADELVLALEHPPLWLMELSMTRDVGRAAQLLDEFASSVGDKALTEEYEDDLLIACLFLRYENGRMDWLEFLWQTAEFDCTCESWCKNCKCRWAYFDEWRTKQIEEEQRAEVVASHRELLYSMRRLYNRFMIFAD